MMPHYRLCGMTVESRFPLPELPRSHSAPCCVFSRSRPRRRARRPRWYHHWYEQGGRRVLSFARTDARYLLRFPRMADFEIAANLARITARPRNGLPAETLRHLLLDQVWPLALSARGHVVLHASAVVLPDGRALAFAGPAGSGKSSLAAAFALAGGRILTDDCLPIRPTSGGWSAVPSYPGLRLWPDMLRPLAADRHVLADVAHYTGKKRLTGSALPFASGAAPLSAVYILRRRGSRAALAVSLLARAPAILKLVSLSYLLDHQDRKALARSFDQLARLTAAVPVRELELPHAPRQLAEAVALVSRT